MRKNPEDYLMYETTVQGDDGVENADVGEKDIVDRGAFRVYHRAHLNGKENVAQ